MQPTALFNRVIKAISDFCALQREMAERSTELEMRARGELEKEPDRRATDDAWDEWDQRYLR